VATPPCPDFEILLERFADAECDPEESLRAREHLSECAPCRIGLRSVTELNRRIAQSPPPPVPPDLEARLRQALRREGQPRRLRVWIPAAAAAVLAVAVLFLRPLPASATSIPRFVAGGALFHGRYLAAAPAFNADSPNEMRAYFRRALDAEVVMPAFDAGPCKGGGCTGACPCSIDPAPVPWILYRRGDTAVSLLIVPAASDPLPDSARRSSEGRDYYAFAVRGATALVRPARSQAFVWIAKIPEAELLECVLRTSEGRDAFSGAPVSASAILCRACCGKLKGGDVKAGPGVKLGFLQLTAAGRKGIDLNQLMREGQEP
jgi:anti-sigma factor RsiW